MKSTLQKRFGNLCRRGMAIAMVMIIASGRSSYFVAEAAPGQPLSEKYTGFDGMEVEWKYGSSSDTLTYADYRADNEAVPYASEDIEVPLSEVRDENGALTVAQFEGKEAIYAGKSSEYAEFTVSVPSDASYQLEIDYYLTTESSDPAKRILYIDGVSPFEECSDLIFYRYFEDEGEPVINSVGDETRPSQAAIPGWRTQRLIDTSGVSSTPFIFTLSEGEHTIQLIYNKVDMYIGGIRLVAPESCLSYEEVKASYEANGYTAAQTETVRFQAESTTVEKNDVILRRDNDGDPLVEPASTTNRKLNVMGGYRWRSGNQSITWEFEVKEDGLYKIGMYAQQSWNDGLPSYRQIAIDGKVPFEELLEYKFDYNTKWELETLSSDSGEPYLFYLTAGTHTITMTVKFGALGDVLASMENDISVLSDMLLNINLLTGNDPDPNYDYQFFQKIPDLQAQMEYIVESMRAKYDNVKSLASKTPAMANNFLTIKSQVESMLDNPYSIARKISDLENSLESLSEWYLSLQSGPLMIDYFDVGSPDEAWKSVSSNIFQKAWATVVQFVSSFSKDYDNVGGVLSEDVTVNTTINVWIARSTEYAEIIKEMADEDFTPETGIAINVNVVPATQLNAGNVNAIMLSITSGKAPDVALGVDVTSPVEFAIREQAVDLSSLEDFEEVKSRFVEAVLTPYEYNGGTFALPETMNFNVMFYRKDLLSEYGVSLPNTRQELYDYVLPALYQNGLEFYFGRDFTQFLFQNGGSYYTEDGLASALDTPQAYQAFKEYTELFTNYGVPETANFYQYMRSGIMPLGVGDFNTYMQLSVAAPEITGKWGIAPLPGVEKTDEDGNTYIDRSAGAITDKGDVILAQSKKVEESWEFLKWWSSTDVQTQFAKEVEALIGAEARWNTANKEAFLSLDWSDADIETLEAMWEWAQETPTVLGSYMTTRYITNAWTTVVISGGDVREALENAVKEINREMRAKQEEYGVIADE